MQRVVSVNVVIESDQKGEAPNLEALRATGGVLAWLPPHLQAISAAAYERALPGNPQWKYVFRPTSP